MSSSDLLNDTAHRYPQRAALVSGALRLSYSELHACVTRCAAGLLQQLSERGLRPGARIGILMRNRWEYVVAMFAIARAGCVAVHLPARFAQGELDYALQKIPLQMLLLDAGLPLQAPGQPGVVCVPADLGAEADAAFSALLACKAKLPQIPPVQADTPGAIMFTSGTTGRPKGAIQPVDGRDLSLRIAQSDFQLHQRDVLVVASPLYHAAGLYTWYQCGVLAGACAVLMPAWDPAQFMRDCARLGISAAFAVPTQLMQLLRHAEFDPAKLVSLRLVVFGGAPCEPQQIEALEAALPQVRFVQNYGQTETGPLFSQDHADRLQNRDAIGRPNALAEIRLMAEPGREAAVGEVGELVTRGSHLMLGYFDDPAPTAEFFRYGDGWGATGDLAVRDAQGYITLAGRSRDIIIAGAVNIYPAEIERIVRSHPAVEDCAAFGVKDALWGELPVVAVVRRGAAPGGLMQAKQLAAEISALFEGDEIGRHKRPRAVHVVESLPYTPAGKLLRGALRERFPVLPGAE